MEMSRDQQVAKGKFASSFIPSQCANRKGPTEASTGHGNQAPKPLSGCVG